MEQYIIKGGHPLVGEVEIGGAKNAALAILAAAIMTDETVLIDNLPDVNDINVLIDAIEGIGAKVHRVDRHTVKINGASIKNVDIEYDYIKKIRASYYLLGALLGKYKRAEVALPGGCNIGSRPIDQHLKGFRALGADVDIEHGKIVAEADRLVGKHIYFDVVSVGATINVMMAAAMAVSAAPAAFAAERADSETIKEDNQPAADADSDTQEDADAQDSADADKTADAEGTKTEYPLTITTYDYDGNEIETTYEKAPEKVLAVYQGSIETMLALGLEDRLVATAGLDNEVPDELKDAFSKTNYLDEFTPSLETVTMLEPDMILSWSSLFSDKNLGNVTDWIDKGCNTYYNTNTRPDGDRTLENEFTDILNLGKIFDVQDKAQAIVDDAKAVIDKTLTATADVEEKPSVMVLEPLGEDITNYGAKSLGGDMVTQLGATLANPDASTVGKEDIIAANPDVIFVVYMPYAGDDPETVKESQLAVIKDDEALQSLDAVKNGRVYPIMLSEMYASATRTQDGIETFAKGLYPDVNLD